MAHTFVVDEVEAVVNRLPRAEYELSELLGAPVVARSPMLDECVAGPRLGFGGMNGFALAVHLAFSEHRPLTLSPDAVWLVILQGLALHVREHEGELRERFVGHQGPKTIVVESTVDVDWTSVVEEFVSAIGREVNPGLMSALSDRFTTTGEVEHAAHCVAVMDSFSRFFDYELTCVCGIPSVTLLGTSDDWRELQLRFEVLAEYGLQWWAEQLAPVLEEFALSAEGKPNRKFWRSIYKPEKAYGENRTTGWLTRLFPYLEDPDGSVRKNPMPSAKDRWIHEPQRSSAFPKGLSQATLRLSGVSVGAPRMMTVSAGFFGVRQQPDSSLMPHIGWSVLEESTAKLWEKLSRAHTFAPPRGDRQLEGPSVVPALLQEFYSHFDGGPLYEGELTLTPAPHGMTGLHDWAESGLFVSLPTSEDGLLVAQFGLKLGTLRDGGELLWIQHGSWKERQEVVVLRSGASAQPPYSVVANSLLEFYQRLAGVASFPPWEVKGRWAPER